MDIGLYGTGFDPIVSQNLIHFDLESVLNLHFLSFSSIVKLISLAITAATPTCLTI